MKRLLGAMWQHGAQSSLEQNWWEYVWDYQEEPIETDTADRDFAYFDYSSGEGAHFARSSAGANGSESMQDSSRGNGEESDPQSCRAKLCSSGDSDAVVEFAAAFASAVKASTVPWGSAAKSWLVEKARAAGMFRCYLESSVNSLMKCLLVAITDSKWKDAQSLKTRKRIVLSHVHPDRHADLTDEGRTLHNRITASLIVLL